MKIGIITIYDLNNYGNRLQNYASTFILQSLGCDVETLLLDDLSYRTHLKNFLRIIIGRKPVINSNLKEENRLYIKDYDDLEKKRFWAFKTFSHNYMSIRYKRITKFLDCKYDYFITGSDQVWNTDIGHGRPCEFLTFAKHKKRISLAASFGGDNIHTRVDEVARYINEMKTVSVREETGVEFIRQITGRDTISLIDPVLMLEKEVWRLLSKKMEHSRLQKKYIILFFLGSISDEVQLYANELSRNNDMNIVTLNSKNDQDFYSVGPGEFLYLVDNASLILTDSFHGSVFSFLFDKPFLVFDRISNIPNMMSRINCFLKMFSLERKYIHSDMNNNVWENDYRDGKNVLLYEREKEMNYIRNALGI